MCWWSLFRLVTLLHLVVSSTEHSQPQEELLPKPHNMTSIFLNAVGANPNTSLGVCASKVWRKPVCKEGEGCDVPLNCFNYSLLNVSSNETITGNSSEKGVIEVDGYKLEKILEDPSITNTCAIVMIYASWCPFCVHFARQYNALGRSYRELPVFAINLDKVDMYKYLTAYIPLVRFYYRGKVIYRFKATESYEELLEQITKMTGFQPVRVDLLDPRNDYPVATVRTDGDTVYFIGAFIGVLLIAIVYVCTTEPAISFFHSIARKFDRTKTE